jgi:hypothetical protein
MMPIVHRLRVDGIANAFNRCGSAFDVDVLDGPDGAPWVIVTDLGTGPSITNTAETACPQIAVRLGLAFADCRFFERYRFPVESGRCDTLDRILFEANAPLGRTASGLPLARLAVPGWRPARGAVLRRRGLELSHVKPGSVAEEAP